MSRLLFPKIVPYYSEWLDVGDGHRLYLEQSGNPQGIPVIYLHGGPGAGSSESHRRYFSPDKYRIIMFDQRGCGRSIPSPSLLANTLWHLVDDIERVRQHLAIEQWLVTGGSWGTTLAMVYGIKHAKQVLGFILRGIFLGTQTEYQWLYQPQGAAKFYPEYYRDFLAVLPAEQRDVALVAYQNILLSDNEVAILAASKAWCLWELRLSTLEHHNLAMLQIEDTHQALCMAKISNYFFNHNCFLMDNYIMRYVDKISHIPAIVLHGRFDMVCQLVIADKLVEQWDNARLHILPYAGHSGFERQTIDGFCKAADTMANFISEVSSE